MPITTGTTSLPTRAAPSSTDRPAALRRSSFQGIALIGLIVIRLPFFATHAIFDDAYIAYRCALNLADHHVYGFNATERLSSSTSHAHIFIVAGLRRLFGDAFILADLVVNAVACLIGILLLSRALVEDDDRARRVWIAASCLPAAFLITYTGLETSLLVLCLGLVVSTLRHPRLSTRAAVGLLCLAWVRPDAVAYGLIVLAALMLRDGRIPIKGLLMLGIGAASMSLFNRMYFGQWLHHAITAKRVSYEPQVSVDALFSNLSTVFWSNRVGGVFSPFPTKYAHPLGPLFVTGVALAFLWLLARNWQHREKRVVMGALIGVSVVMPMAYAAGGVVFPWYLWPSSLCAFLVILAGAADRLAGVARPARRFAVAAVVVIAILAVAQWCVAFKDGIQERRYRGGIGEYLASIAQPADTLLLEPAGSIPFYSGLYTYDEIGLVSNRVVEYRLAWRERWWPQFVKDVRPTYLVERSHILSGRTVDGYQLTPDERRWLETHYRLVRRFHYVPEEHAQSPVAREILRLGSDVDYFVFRRNEFVVQTELRLAPDNEARATLRTRK